MSDRPPDALDLARTFRAARYHHPDGWPTLYHGRDGIWRHWDGTCYRNVDEAAIRAQVYVWLHDSGAIADRSGVSDIMDALKAVARIEPDAPCWVSDCDGDPDATEILTMQNGLVHLSDDGPDDALPPIYCPSTPRFYSINALDYAYRPDADDPVAWLAFLTSIWPNDLESVCTLQEWFGYCLTCDTALEKMLLLIGPPRSGKGTMAAILSSMIGETNCCGPTLAGMSGSFGMSGMVGKLLAVVSDARLSGRTDQAIITERLLSVSGRDLVQIDRKYAQPIDVRLPTRIMLLTNELPGLDDVSGALANRFICLRMTKSFLGKENTGLRATLLAEMPAILNWAIGGRRTLRKRGKFLQPKNGNDAVRSMMTLGSPVSSFLRDWCEVGTGLTASVADMFSAWQCWCSEQNIRRAGNSATFGRDLRTARPQIRAKQRRTSDGIERVYRGVRLTLAAEQAMSSWRSSRACHAV